MPVATTTNFSLEQFSAYSILFIIAVGGTCSIIQKITQKISLNLIRRSFDRNKAILEGYGVDHWVKQIVVPSEISFNQTQDNVIEFCRHDYFFIAYSSYPISFGTLGPHALTEIKYWCLIAVGNSEVEILEQNPKLFRRLSEYNPLVGAYIIRSLTRFARMVREASELIACKTESELRAREEQPKGEPGNAPS